MICLPDQLPRPQAGRNLAILLCYYDHIPKQLIADYFEISKRYVNLIIAQEKSEAIEQSLRYYNEIKMRQTQPNSQEMEIAQEDGTESVRTPENRLERARLCSQIAALKKKTKTLKLQVDKLTSITKAKTNLMEPLECQMEPLECQCGVESPNGMPIVEEMARLLPQNKYARRYSDRMFRFSYTMMTLSPRSYTFARKCLALPARSVIYDKYRNLTNHMKHALTNIDAVHVLLDSYIDADVISGNRIVCTIGVDAFAFRLFLKQIASLAKIKQSLSQPQLARLAPLLDNKDLMDKIQEADDSDSEDDLEAEGEEELLNIDPDHLTDEKITELFETYNSCFIYCLLPLNSSLPCFPIHLAPATHGMSQESNIETVNQLSKICSQYNIDIVYMAVDGDPGWNSQFTKCLQIIASYNMRRPMLDWCHNVYNECRANGVHLAITDLLHLVKRARGRYLDHQICVFGSDESAVTNYDAAYRALGPCMALYDRSQLGRMRDYYPLEMFTIHNLLVLLKERLFPDALYFAPFVLLLLVVRVPFFQMSLRLQMLNASFLIVLEIITDVCRKGSQKDDDGKPRVTQRDVPKSDMVTFAEKSTLGRILCTIVAYACAFQRTPENQRTDALGTHIVEQIIGNGRHGGDARWERILATFCQSVLRTIFMGMDGLSSTPRGRLKAAGCRLTDDGDVSLIDFDDVLFSQVLIHSVTEPGRATDDFEPSLSRVISWIEQLDEIISTRQDEIGRLWPPNPVTNSAILARLIKSSLSDYTCSNQKPKRSKT